VFDGNENALSVRSSYAAGPVINFEQFRSVCVLTPLTYVVIIFLLIASEIQAVCKILASELLKR
jgi:hypothetical protein